MKMMDFQTFLRDKNLTEKTDEEKVKGLIQHLVNETAPRVLIQEFPETETQARYFIKNCVTPSNVFYVRCSLDESQNRMQELGKSHPNYLPSSILSKKIRQFNQHA